MVSPSGVERVLEPDEIIVSKTDVRGHMTYVNDTFVRMCRYSEAELLGRPHNLIRHPDMPRSVFRLLWDTIAAGEEVFAYVVNLAADGAHYWVLAHVTPTLSADGEIIGYHSNRRAPARAAVEQVRPVYAALLAEEQRHPRARQATEAGMKLLEQVLVEAGMTYPQFVWSLIADPRAA